MLPQVKKPLGRKIDWHNYDLIAMESERTGRLNNLKDPEF
jgi:hypothetical protein